METVKTLGVVAVLGVVGYLGYVTITSQPETTPATDGNAPWSQPETAATDRSAPPFEGTTASINPPVAGSLDITPGREVSPDSLGLGGETLPSAASPSAEPPIPGASVPPASPNAETASAESQAASEELHGIRPEFAGFLDAVRRKLDAGEFSTAHEVLTTWHRDQRITPEERAALLDLLDQVAGTVIFSRQHLLEPPYTVKPGETLGQIADRYAVPWELLAKINGIRDPDHIPPGTQLKVVRGPFDAIVRLQERELTLMLDGKYAGRFRIGVGTDVDNLVGEYRVCEKRMHPIYYGPDGTIIDADSPNNPLGKYWIGLGGRIALHGTNDPANFDRPDAKGTIFLADRDIEDLYSILSINSHVTIEP
ncbi:MAG: LysM peptidoglycan-binding domain-containing protein [Planctomycetota bacterium]|nr:MAG: LysM peptidoglycan-binding domain-containing protein [Planctomycetota bacterium]